MKRIEIIKIGLVDCKSACPEVLNKLQNNCGALGVSPEKTQKIVRAGRFIDHIWRTQGKAVVSLPCGGGKTEWTFAYLTDCVDRWDNPETRLEDIPSSCIIVVDSVKTAEERVARLRAMEVAEKYLGIYHSHNEDECQRLSGREITYQEIRKEENRHICKECGGREECKYNNRYSELCKRIVFMCHEGFCRLHEQNKVPRDYDIIIDEEITNLFYDTLRRPELEAFLKHVPSDNSDALQSIKDIIEELLDFMNSPDECKATHKWQLPIRKDTKTEAIEDLYEESQSSEDMDLDLYADHYRDLIYKLAYVLPEDFSIYVWPETNEITIARDRINFQIPNKVILLNGSAQLSMNIYNQPEMRIWCCPEVEEVYDNVTLHCLKMNPTKNRMKHEDCITELMEYAKEVFGSVKDSVGQDAVFFALNKTNDEMEEAISLYFPLVQEKDIGHRGSLIGRNDWRDYDNGLVGSSLFTNLGIYALFASLRNNKEYAQCEIFREVLGKDGHARLSPQFTRNFHIVNRDIDDEFQRRAVYELHQYIMRLSCRHQTKDPVHVVAIIPNIEMLLLLHDLMPGFIVDSPDPMLKLANHLLNSDEPIMNDEIYDKFGLAKNGDTLRRIREVMSKYGWILTKLDGARGNVKEWVREIVDTVD